MERAEAARDESGGAIGMVSDEQISLYQKLLAEKDGVFCEPACAVSIAGVVDINNQKRFEPNDVIVSIITGHGLKDPDHAIKSSSEPLVVESNYDSVMKAIFPTH